jgi:hypothetical protein
VSFTIRRAAQVRPRRCGRPKEDLNESPQRSTVVPVDLQSMDLPRDARHRTPAFHRTRLLAPLLLAACTAHTG